MSSPPCTNGKSPCTNVKPSYWRLSGDGSGPSKARENVFEGTPTTNDIFWFRSPAKWMRKTRHETKIQGDTKKTVTKIGITSKIFFRLTKNFSYIRSSLCSRHLQVSSLYYKNSCFTDAQKMCSKWAPGAAGTFGSGGQSSWWPSRIPPLVSLLLLLWFLPSGQG